MEGIYTWKATIIVVTTAGEMKFSFNLRSNAELHTPSGGRIGTRNNLRFQVINQICVRRRQVNFNERTIRRFPLKSLNRKYAPRNKRTIPWKLSVKAGKHTSPSPSFLPSFLRNIPIDDFVVRSKGNYNIRLTTITFPLIILPLNMLAMKILYR